jgi:ribosomal protein S18 acetylase RimI-like enzyme
MTAVRSARMEDLESTVAMLNEHARGLHGVDDMTSPDLKLYWESPDVVFDTDVVVAESSGGEIVGYADIGIYGEHVWLDVRATEPEALPSLLGEIEERAAARKPDLTLMGYTSDQDDPLRRLYDESGYELIRHSFRMRIELDQQLPEPEWPDGYGVRATREGEDRRFYDAQMASFADTWMFAPEPYESWRHYMVDDSVFDPALWLVVEQGDDLAGILIARAPENEPGVGWIRILGVVPEHRQRGLGEALLRHSFRDFAGRGFDAVGLGVDAENPTGAVRLYERAGMRVERTSLIYEKHQG